MSFWGCSPIDLGLLGVYYRHCIANPRVRRVPCEMGAGPDPLFISSKFPGLLLCLARTRIWRRWSWRLAPRIPGLWSAGRRGFAPAFRPSSHFLKRLLTAGQGGRSRAARMMALTASRWSARGAAFGRREQGFDDVPLFVCDVGVAGLSVHDDAIISSLRLLYPSSLTPRGMRYNARDGRIIFRKSGVWA